MRALFITLLVILTVAFGFAIYWCAYIYNLTQSGTITNGIVLQYEEIKCSETLCFRYTIRFETTDSVEEIIHLDLTRNYAKVNDVISIMYDPAKPQEAQVVDNKMHLFNCVGGMIFLVFMITGVIWCLFNMKKVDYFVAHHVGGDW